MSFITMPLNNRSLALLTALCVLLAASAAPAGDKKPAPEDGEEDPQPTHVGIELGAFYIKDFRPVEATKTKLSFTLYAVVKTEDADRFEALLSPRTHRMRNEVITAARLCEPLDYEDPTLDKFRRRVQVRLRRALPRLAVDDIYVTKFSYTFE